MQLGFSQLASDKHHFLIQCLSRQQ